eukprot:1335654-Pleurochrysis_carterae.AAC.3
MALRPTDSSLKRAMMGVLLGISSYPGVEDDGGSGLGTRGGKCMKGGSRVCCFVQAIDEAQPIDLEQPLPSLYHIE